MSGRKLLQPTTYVNFGLSKVETHVEREKAVQISQSLFVEKKRKTVI